MKQDQLHTWKCLLMLHFSQASTKDVEISEARLDMPQLDMPQRDSCFANVAITLRRDKQRGGIIQSTTKLRPDIQHANIALRFPQHRTDRLPDLVPLGQAYVEGVPDALLSA